jgi:hypothetical protein
MAAFLRCMDDYHQSINERGLPALLLAGGQWFEGRASSSGYRSAKDWKRRNRPRTNDCYYNAQSFCLEHEEARYFEGYALFTPGIGPDEHSWVVMPDGKVVDFTFEAVERIARRKGLRYDAADTLYVGLEVPTEFIRETMLTSEWFDSLAESYFAG